MFAKGSFLLKIKRIIEAAIVLPVYIVLRLLPLAAASFLIGKLLRLLGPLHSSHETALRNLRFCFPEKSEQEIQEIALNSWENLGRTAGELPHITSYTNDKILEICPISGLEHITATEKYAGDENKAGFIIISAHIGNWELGSRTLLSLDPNTALVYRKANNPYVDKLIQRLRGKYTSLIIPKGDAAGVRDIVKHIKKGGRLGMLIDQKMRDGISVKFFGAEVKAPVLAGEFASKYNMPIVMGRAMRNESTKQDFVLRFEKPIYPENRSAEEITQKIYDTYEAWIRQYPNQWFWQHNRFDLADKK